MRIIVKNKTIIGLKLITVRHVRYENWVKNKTIIGLKFKKDGKKAKEALLLKIRL